MILSKLLNGGARRILEGKDESGRKVGLPKSHKTRKRSSSPSPADEIERKFISIRGINKRRTGKTTADDKFGPIEAQRQRDGVSYSLLMQ